MDCFWMFVTYRRNYSQCISSGSSGALCKTLWDKIHTLCFLLRYNLLLRTFLFKVERSRNVTTETSFFFFQDFWKEACETKKKLWDVHWPAGHWSQQCPSLLLFFLTSQVVFAISSTFDYSLPLVCRSSSFGFPATVSGETLRLSHSLLYLSCKIWLWQQISFPSLLFSDPTQWKAPLTLICRFPLRLYVFVCRSSFPSGPGSLSLSLWRCERSACFRSYKPKGTVCA